MATDYILPFGVSMTVVLVVLAFQVAVAPPALHGEAVVFDPVAGRMIVHGGASSPDNGRTLSPFGETWAWRAGTWTRLNSDTSGPGERSAHAMIFDPATRRILLFGGRRFGAAGQPLSRLCDTWVLEGDRWTWLDGAGCVSTRLGAGLVHDDRRQQLLLVEGAGPMRDPIQPLRIWRWAGASWLLVDSTGPRRHAGELAAFDRARGVLVVPVFRGPDSGTWEWNGASWSRGPISGPGDRESYSLAYDPERRLVVLAGGEGEPTPHNDLWAWDGRNWSALEAQGTPPVRRWAASLLADGSGKLLLYGGAGPGVMHRDLWMLDGGRWRQVF